MFRKADRERLDRIDQNFLNFINGVKKATLENEEIRRGLIDLDTARFNAITNVLIAQRDDIEKKFNVVLAHISETSGVDTALVREEITCAANRVIDNQGRITGRLAVKGKENGLKKRVLKRKSGR